MLKTDVFMKYRLIGAEMKAIKRAEMEEYFPKTFEYWKWDGGYDDINSFKEWFEHRLDFAETLDELDMLFCELKKYDNATNKPSTTEVILVLFLEITNMIKAANGSLEHLCVGAVAND